MIALLLAVLTSTAPPDQLVRGRVKGYRGLVPFHVAALRTRDLATPEGPLGWGTADPETGRFDIRIPADLDEVYLLGHLDLARTGPRLDSGMLFFLRKLPLDRDTFSHGRLVFDLGDMDLAHVVRDRGPGGAIWIALGLVVFIYGVGWLWARRLPKSPAPPRAPPPRADWVVWLIAAATTLPAAVALNRSAIELLEFTYLHEGLRPDSVLSLLVDPISSELSHPPLWPLVLRALAAVSRADWWLRVPSLLAHVGLVWVMFRLVALALGRPAGRLAALLAGLLPIPFYYAGDAAPYSVLGLLAAAAALCALRERWRAFAALLVAGFFIHYTVGILGVALGLGLLWHARATGDPARFRRALLAFGWVCALPLVWSVHFIRTFLASGMSTRLMSVDYLPDPGFLTYVTRFATTVLGLPEPLQPAAPLALLLALWGARAAVRRAPLLGRLAAVQLTMVVGYVLFVHTMYMQFGGGRVFYAYRWTAVLNPAVVVCYAAALADLAARARPAAFTTAAALVAAMLWFDATLLTPQRPAQREAAAIIQSEHRPGDAFAALPAVYYAQLLNYHVKDRHPADLLAWPTWTDGLYGPLHPVNTSLETLSKHLAFDRVWVAHYEEQMFGTPKFDPATSEHQLAWMRDHLVPDGAWPLDHLTLYRFRVPPSPDDLWTPEGTAELVFHHGLKNFRYFPQHLHTQQTGLIMRAEHVHVRVPTPPDPPRTLDLTIDMHLGRPAAPTDLRLADHPLTFTPVPGGGRWTTTLPITPPLLDLHLHRSPEAAADHRTTTLTLTRPEAP